MSGETAFPRLREVMPERLIAPGNQYAYIRATSVPKFMRDGWRQAPRTEIFEVGGVAYMVMEKGSARPRQGAYIPEVQVEVQVGEAVKAGAGGAAG